MPSAEQAVSLLGERWPSRGPHRLTALTWLRAGIGYDKAFAEGKVPDSFWSEDIGEDGETPVALISCPCGETPVAPLIQTTECECGRFYLNLGKGVRVFRPEGVEAALPPA